MHDSDGSTKYEVPSQARLQECPVCGYPGKLWVEIPMASVLRCARCNHCYTDVATIIKNEEYGSEYYLETHKNWFQNPNLPLFELLAKEIVSQGAETVLDVGCGNGAFLEYLSRMPGQRQLTGVDLSNAAGTISGVTIYQGDFLSFPFDSTFDSVVTLAVIEHLSDVSHFVNRLYDLTKAGGRVYIMTLDEGGLLYQTANVLRLLGIESVFRRLYDPHHLNHFNGPSLKKLLTKDGLFRVEKVIHHNTPLSAIDIPASNWFAARVMRIGVAIIFGLGRLTGRAYLQTIVAARSG